MSPTYEMFRKTYGATDFFASDDEYEAFRQRFGDELRPELEENREARRKSEDEARKHSIY